MQSFQRFQLQSLFLIEFIMIHEVIRGRNFIDFFRLRCQTLNRLEVVKAEFEFRGGITFEITFCHCLKMIVAFRELKTLLFEKSDLSLESLKVSYSKPILK